MTNQTIDRIFAETAYIRTGGSEAELKAAQYLRDECAKLGLSADIVPFEVDMATVKTAKLIVDGVEIPCKGYLCAGCAEVEADFYYLSATDDYSKSLIKDKIVMIDGYLGYWMYQDLLEKGAVGFITYDGHVNYADRDIDQRELRSYVSQGKKIPGVNINAKDAVEIINRDAKKAKIILDQDEYKGESRNVILDMPGEIDEWIVCTAHYDSTSLSTGAYDNMSGSIAILAIAEYFTTHKHKYGIRIIWCGSEERGLLGSKAYCAAADEETLGKIALNVNIDMVGCIMGKFIACCTSEERFAHYINYFGKECGMVVESRDGVYSSDSTPFADKGIPAVSFARVTPANVATIHNSYDTLELMKASRMAEDIDFICAFTDRMANAKIMPVPRSMPDKMKDQLDKYLCRKR